MRNLAQGINTQALAAFAVTINANDDDNYAMGGSLAFTESELTIASGSVVATRSAHTIDTESDAASDDLSNIGTGSVSDGCILHIRANNTGRTVVVKDAAGSAGQIHLADSADFTLDDDQKSFTLQRRGADWYEIARDTQPTTIPAPNFTSSDQAVTIDSQLDVAHGRGAVPSLWSVALKCNTAEDGYEVGDEIVIGTLGSAIADQQALAFADTTNVSIVTGIQINILDSSTFNTGVIVPSNWRWVVRAWS